MRRVLLISLSLILALVGWNMVCAEDFYVIPVLKGKYAPVPKTGQTATYATGDDGDLEKGVAWPTPRFTDNGNGTVTDNLTGLVWVKEAYNVPMTWADAVSAAANAHDGQYGLTDGSKPGDWRLPNVRELQSLIDYARYGPALPVPNPFEMLQWQSEYWSSTTYAAVTTMAWCMTFNYGVVSASTKSTTYNYSWFVRGGK